MKYMHNPHYKITLTNPSSVSEVFEDRQLEQAQIIREESSVDTALLTFGNKPALYPKFPSGSTVKVEVKDGSAAYVTPPLFNGMVLYPVYGFGSISKITFQCVGTGYPLNMMNCAEEYGTQSRHFTLANNLNSLYAVITDADYGLIPKWVNKYMGGSTDSGYSINIDNIDVIAGEIIYQSFPYKPVNKCLDDICDYLTANNSIYPAQNSTIAGPHWIVDTDGKLRVKLVDSSQTGWTKYYGDSQTDATLIDGVDFIDGSFEPLGKEANCVHYYGTWRKPGGGDACEANHAMWGTDTADRTYTDETGYFTTTPLTEDAPTTPSTDMVSAYDGTLFDDGDVVLLNDDITVNGELCQIDHHGTGPLHLNDLYMTVDLINTYYTASNAKVQKDPNHIVGDYSVQGYASTIGGLAFAWPIGGGAAWDFSAFTDFNTPNINFYLSQNSTVACGSIRVELVTAGTYPTQDCFYYDIDPAELAERCKFYHFSFPIGPYAI